MMYELYYKNCWAKITNTPNIEKFYFIHSGIRYIVIKETKKYGISYLAISPYSTATVFITNNNKCNALLINVMTRYAYRKRGYGRKLLDFIYHLMLIEKHYITIEWDSTLDGMHLYPKLPYAIQLDDTNKFQMTINPKNY